MLVLNERILASVCLGDPLTVMRVHLRDDSSEMIVCDDDDRSCIGMLSEVAVVAEPSTIEVCAPTRDISGTKAEFCIKRC